MPKTLESERIRNRLRYKNGKKDYDREYLKKRSNSAEYKFRKYKSDAVLRGLVFLISLDEFKLLWQQPCKYCGSIIETIGIDRVDNNVGYQIDNVVPCCVICNKMKNNHTKESFIEHCRKIIQISGC